MTRYSNGEMQRMLDEACSRLEPPAFAMEEWPYSEVPYSLVEAVDATHAHMAGSKRVKEIFSVPAADSEVEKSVSLTMENDTGSHIYSFLVSTPSNETTVARWTRFDRSADILADTLYAFGFSVAARMESLFSIPLMTYEVNADWVQKWAKFRARRESMHNFSIVAEVPLDFLPNETTMMTCYVQVNLGIFDLRIQVTPDLLRQHYVSAIDYIVDMKLGFTKECTMCPVTLDILDAGSEDRLCLVLTERCLQCQEHHVRRHDNPVNYDIQVNREGVVSFNAKGVNLEFQRYVNDLNTSSYPPF